MYYLISRYYDPDTGRFISPDSILSDSSLFTYCGNDPVNGYDPTGEFSWGKFLSTTIIVLSIAAIVTGAVLCTTGAGAAIGVILIGAGVGGLIGESASIVSQGLEKGWENINWDQVAWDGVIGMASGAIIASPLSAFGTGVAIGALSFTHNVVGNVINNENINWGQAVTIGLVSGIFAGGAKYLANSTSLSNKFVNNLNGVKNSGNVVNNFASYSRSSYQAYWMNVVAGQTLYKAGTRAVIKGAETIIKTVINSLYN